MNNFAYQKAKKYFIYHSIFSIYNNFLLYVKSNNRS